MGAAEVPTPAQWRRHLGGIACIVSWQPVRLWCPVVDMVW